MDVYYRLIRAIFGVLLRVLCRLRVEGLEALPRQGPLIVVSNHLHFLDVPVIMVALPVRCTVLAAEKWEKRPIVNWLFKAGGAVFVNRGTADRKALGKMETLLRAGAIVAMAPEGTRSKTGGLQEGKRGAAFLAARTGAMLIPVVAYGQERVFRELRRLRRAHVVVRVGEPFTLPPLLGPHRSRQLDRMTFDIMIRIAQLLPPEYRGVYRPYVPEEASVGEYEPAGLSVPEAKG